MIALHQLTKGGLIVGNDSVDQATQWSMIYCLTAGNLQLRMVDPQSGVGATADITVPMSAGQFIMCAPKRILATGLTGTYAGFVGT